MSLFKTNTTNTCQQFVWCWKETKKIKTSQMAEQLGILRTFLRNKKDYQKAVRISDFYSNSCIKYESNVDRNKILSIKKYLDRVKPYSKEVSENLIH